MNFSGWLFIYFFLNLKLFIFVIRFIYLFFGEKRSNNPNNWCSSKSFQWKWMHFNSNPHSLSLSMCVCVCVKQVNIFFGLLGANEANRGWLIPSATPRRPGILIECINIVAMVSFRKWLREGEDAGGGANLG